MSADEWAIDPFEGIELVKELPPKPTSEFVHEVESSVPEVKNNTGIIRGLKKQAVEEFVKYLKANCAGEIDATTMTVTLVPLEFSDLDRAVEYFLHSS